MDLFNTSHIRGVHVNNHQVVTVAVEGGPSDLMGGGEHFNECPIAHPILTIKLMGKTTKWQETYTVDSICDLILVYD
jgi:hypothetical protein